MAKKIKQNLKNDILSKYMEYVLNHGKAPESVYRFCKDSEISEQDFYSHFGSFKGMNQSFWETMVHNTVAVITKDKEFMTASLEDQLLTFYFTFFENMLANRSYVLLVLHGNRLEDLKQLKYLRGPVIEFFKNLPDEEKYNKLNFLPESIKEISFQEASWVQMLTIIRFWLNDTSPKFEKTDALIEKSIRAASELKNFPPMESLLDLGKFLYHESKTIL